MTSRNRQLVGVALLAIGGVAILLTFAVQGLLQTRDLVSTAERRTLDLSDDSFRCLDARLQKTLPSHALVFFEAPNGDGWDQRAIEGSFPRYRVAATEDRANYVVVLSASAPGCDGVQVRIARTP